MHFTPLQASLAVLKAEFALVLVCGILLEAHTARRENQLSSLALRVVTKMLTQPFTWLALGNWGGHCSYCERLSKLRRISVMILWVSAGGLMSKVLLNGFYMDVLHRRPPF